VVSEHEEMIPLRRPRHKWEDNVRMDIREIVWEGVDWVHLWIGTSGRLL